MFAVEVIPNKTTKDPRVYCSPKLLKQRIRNVQSVEDVICFIEAENYVFDAFPIEISDEIAEMNTVRAPVSERCPGQLSLVPKYKFKHWRSVTVVIPVKTYRRNMCNLLWRETLKFKLKTHLLNRILAQNNKIRLEIPQIASFSDEFSVFCESSSVSYVKNRIFSDFGLSTESSVFNVFIDIQSDSLTKNSLSSHLFDTKVLRKLKYDLQNPSKKIVPKRVLLTAAESGSGKSTLVRHVLKELEQYYVSIDSHSLVLYSFLDQNSFPSDRFAQISKIPNAVVVIENAEDFSTTDDEIEDYSVAVKEFIRNSECFIIGIASSVSELTEEFRRLFQEEIVISPLTKTQKLDYLIEETSDFETVENFDSILNQCNGFQVCDMVNLVEQMKFVAYSLKSREISEKIMKIALKHTSLGKPTVGVEFDVPDVTWDSIGGLEAIKRRLKDIIMSSQSLKYRDAVRRLGGEDIARRCSHVLLFSVPGTGKTLLAKAVASSFNCRFFAVSIPSLIQCEIGESEKRLHSIFQKARRNAPSVIFLDEFQAMFVERSAQSGGEQQLTTQLMVELDALQEQAEELPVTVLAATNIPQVIDAALLRPGRFSDVIYVPLPDSAGRRSIVAEWLRRVSRKEDVDVDAIVERTEGYSGADLKQLFSAVGLEVMKRGGELCISRVDVERALKISEASTTENMIRELQLWAENIHK